MFKSLLSLKLILVSVLEEFLEVCLIKIISEE